MISTVMTRIDSWRATRVRHTSRHWKALEQIPEGLFDYWRATAHREFEGIPRDAFFFASATDGLLDFFATRRFDQAPCGLPSMAADSVWHAWMRYSPSGLDAFCTAHFGRTIAHVEAEALGDGMDLAMARTLAYSRGLEGHARGSMHLPRLFTLDRRLRIPGGYGYRIATGQVAWQRLDRSGRPAGGFVYPEAFTTRALFVAGLITQLEYLDATYSRQRRRNDGGSVELSASDCDGGGSCGGGCGGGD